MNCEKCGKADPSNRIDLFWESRDGEPRKHNVCDTCFDEIQSMFSHDQ